MKKYIFILLLLVFCFGFSSPYYRIIAGRNAVDGTTDYTQDANCQGAWLFNDDLTDESGEGNTLTDGGTVSYTSDCPDGYATCGVTSKSIDGDGSSDYLYRTNANLNADFPGKELTEDVSFCVWIYHDISAGGDTIFDKGYRYYYYVTLDDISRLKIEDGDTAAEKPVEADHVTGDWIHHCVSFDGSTTLSKHWVSSDGGSFGDMENETGWTWTNVNGVDGTVSQFCVGSLYDSSNYFDGHIYQLIIFDRTISAAEVENMYDYGIKGAD